MKLKKTALVLAAALAFSTLPAHAKTLEFTMGLTDMYISDGSVQKTVLDSAPYTVNGRTMVPVRVISENFDAQVGWDDATRTVTITADDTHIVLTIGSSVATVNGEEKVLDTAPELMNSRTMVPLRFISEALNRYVEYVEASEQVLISDGEPMISINGYGVNTDYVKFIASNLGIDTDAETLAVYLPDLKAYIAESILTAEAARNAGITVEQADINEVTAYAFELKDNIYARNMLIAPLIKAMEDQIYANAYINSVATLSADEETLKIYNEKFICAKHILISVIDYQTGEYMNDEEKEAAKKTAEEVLKKAKAGADFEELMTEYNEDQESIFYPDGYVFTDGDMIDSFETGAFALTEGEISEVVESPIGYHIIKRLPLPELTADILARIVIDKEIADAEITYNMTDEEIISKILNN